MNTLLAIVVAAVSSGTTYAFLKRCGYVSGRQYRDTQATLHDFQKQLERECANRDSLAAKLERAERTASAYESLLAKSEGMTQAALEKLDAMRIGGNVKCNQCARLRKRIQRFFEQKRIIKQAYVDDVMMKSHGQVDKRALIEAERYLLVDDDNEIRTFGEIRDSEIARSLALLEKSNVEKTVGEEKTGSH